MTATQYNSNNSITPVFEWTSFEKRNKLDALITIPIKAEEGSAIQISFRAQVLNKRQAQSRIRVKNYSWSTIHCVFKIRESRSIYPKNPQSVHFLRQNSSIRKPIHPSHRLQSFPQHIYHFNGRDMQLYNNYSSWRLKLERFSNFVTKVVYPSFDRRFWITVNLDQQNRLLRFQIHSTKLTNGAPCVVWVPTGCCLLPHQLPVVLQN